MISILKKDNWLAVKVLVGFSILIPLAISSYEILFLGKESVVFLESYPPFVGYSIIIYYTLLLFSAAVWLVMQLRSVLSLRNELKKNELLHLQSQVSPHFFFNVLNNLYGMVDQDIAKSKALILKLSDLMRYSIYEGEKSRVALSEELSYIENYIELHKMRYHKQIDVRITKEIADESVNIMPLLLIIMLENAFKHGVENLIKDPYLSIYLKTKEDTLYFGIENNFDENDASEGRGIGLKNLKRRLALAYPKKHKLVIEKRNSVFRAQLEVQLR